jgi:hypothetical protein
MEMIGKTADIEVNRLILSRYVNGKRLKHSAWGMNDVVAGAVNKTRLEGCC